MIIGKSTIRASIFFARRELKTRIVGSITGPLMLFAPPVLMGLLLIVVFSYIFKVKLGNIPEGINYPMFMLTAFIPWMQFQEAVTKAASSVIENSVLVKKVSLPIESLVMGNVIAIHFVYTTLIMLLSLYYSYLLNLNVAITVFLVLIVNSLQLLFSVGLGLILSAVSVYIRDVLQLLPVAFQAWFYASPIVYPLKMVPAGVRRLVLANPWTLFAQSYQKVMLGYGVPDVATLLLVILCSLGMLAAGYALFNHLRDGFAETLP